jgi:hypothetical protein
MVKAYLKALSFDSTGGEENYEEETAVGISHLHPIWENSEYLNNFRDRKYLVECISQAQLRHLSIYLSI